MKKTTDEQEKDLKKALEKSRQQIKDGKLQFQEEILKKTKKTLAKKKKDKT